MRVEVLAILGDNGAGKSTFIKILSGAYEPSAGTLLLDGVPVSFASPQDAADVGIATIFQELALSENLSIAENVFLGRELVRRVLGVPFLKRQADEAEGRRLHTLEAHISDPEAAVGSLSGGQRQAVAISRALNLNARLVIMDEPTAALAVAETRKVLQLIRRLAEGGRAVILISHNMHDVFEVADRIVVFRRGRKIAERRRSETDPEEVVSFITGALIRRESARSASLNSRHSREGSNMHTRSKVALLAAALLAVSSTFALAADKKVAFVPQIIGIPYFDAMEAGGKEAAAKFGVDFIYQGPVDTNPVDQMQIVQNLIDQGVNAVAVSVLDASSIAPVVEAAKAKHVALFTSDSDAPKSGRALYVAQATDEGLGDAIIDEMVKNRVGEDAKIGIVSGEATASNLNAWIGLMQARAKARSEAEASSSRNCRRHRPARRADRDRPHDSQSRPQGPDRRRLHHMPGCRTGHRDGRQDRQGDRNGLLQPEHRTRLPQERRFRLQRALGSGSWLSHSVGGQAIDRRQGHPRDHDA